MTIDIRSMKASHSERRVGAIRRCLKLLTSWPVLRRMPGSFLIGLGLGATLAWTVLLCWIAYTFVSLLLG